MFPVPDYIYFGVHVKEQIQAIENITNIEKEIYFINGRANKWNYLKSINEIKNIIKNGKFDLIHIHYGLSAIFLLFFKPSIPVIITLHSGELFQKKGYFNHLFQKNLTLTVVKYAEKVIVLNNDMISLLSSFKDKLVKLPCGTDLNYFKEFSAKKDTKKFFIGFPGNRERKEKNYALFINIINLLQVDHEIEVIEFHNMNREDVVLNLNKIDLLLMTSTIEGSPQIIKEAMACNKPIVCTAVGDVEDLLKDVDNTYVIDSLIPENFILSIEKIIKLPIEKRRSNGREQLLKIELDAENVAKAVFKLYKELI